ncbi:hypothetical protein AB0A74_38615 [Saccharothrix sp. NPDC042600]|uniref:hypothetical protein n=1 Tax=Saccharothrix TaxID=2071 RepID=UPI0033DA96BC|nr:hypothetical protein GCM10017745_56730 [Saccharothrix mutabilis subsp. capreolus]
MTEPRNLAPFDACPACGHDFGVAPTQGPPSLHLAVAPGPGGRPQWRLSLFDDHGGPGKHWQSPEYDPTQAQDVYWLCGDGHLFFDHHLQGARRTTARIDRFGSAAAVGAVAAGKSYLLLRTLNQDLSLPPAGRDTRTGAPPVKMSGTAFEERPMKALRREYDSTVYDNVPLDPTSLQEMVPAQFLWDVLGEDLVLQIRQIHTELLGASPDRWGAVVRQPIVQRYSVRGRVVITSVADLPGEFFKAETYDQEYRQRALAKYDSLLWTIDPIVEGSFTRFLPPGDADRLTRSSIRPDHETLGDVARARSRRRVQQRDIADRLTAQGDFGKDDGATRKLLVCLTKADLITHAVRQGKRLTELGRTDAVVTGVADYLVDVSNRCAGPIGHEAVVEQAVWTALVRDLTQDLDVPEIREEIARHVARELVAHYSDGERLWNLIHDGGQDRITVDAGGSETELTRRIPVPSIDQHVAASLTPGEGGLLRRRDLVMSALTCGLVYGLGMGQTVRQLFEQRWREVRFYLCSPFGDVPVLSPGTLDRFELDGGHEFPAAGDPSAALTQLKLGLLAGVQL